MARAMKYQKIVNKLLHVYVNETQNDPIKAINMSCKKYRLFIHLSEKELALVILKFMEQILAK